jgi:hypothetical protein
MGDGSNLGPGIKIGTDSFSIKECVLLINILNIKYNINCTIHLNKDKPRIYILADSKDKLISLIKPYMIPSMYYKLGIHINKLLTLEETKPNLIKLILEEAVTLPFLEQEYKNKNLLTEKDMISILIGSLMGSCQMVKIKNTSYIIINQIDNNKNNYLLLIFSKLAELGYCKNIKTNFNFITNKKNKSYYNYFKILINLN